MNSKMNKRRTMRQQQTRKVEFSIVTPGVIPGADAAQNEAGTLIDVSASGIGFYTDAPLEPGNLLKFKNTAFGRTGVVMWTVRAENRYRVGVRFASADQPGA